ncbi:MAG: hypothetical protein Q8N96_10385 [Methylovulum sp.]|nr:hypothetical protein [Methylovulum sp.]
MLNQAVTAFFMFSVRPKTLQCNVSTKSWGLVLLFCTFIVQAETDNPHLIKNDTPHSLCKNCHVADPPFKINSDGLLVTKNNTINPDGFNQDGVAMCASCHDTSSGHKTGLHMDFPLPADLPLDEKNDMICLTCHYTHGSLASGRPQASCSFMDKLLDAGRLHKSYLLRRNNADGELCLICHKVPEGSR